MRTLLMALAFAVAAPSFAHAAELSPEKVAKIRREQQAAMDRIDKAHGNRLPSELSNEERARISGERAAAERAVLDQNGVTTQQYVSYTLRMTTAQRAQEEAEERRLVDAAEQQAEAAKKVADEAEKAAPQVEYGPAAQSADPG